MFDVRSLFAHVFYSIGRSRGGSRGDQSDHATKVKIGQKIGKLKCQSSY